MNSISWFIIHALSLTDCVLILVLFWIACWIFISLYPHTLFALVFLSIFVLYIPHNLFSAGVGGVHTFYLLIPIYLSLQARRRERFALLIDRSIDFVHQPLFTYYNEVTRPNA
jgi:hypothetical protein